jgi:hypothetical protein
MYVCKNYFEFTGQGKFQVLKKKKKLVSYATDQ